MTIEPADCFSCTNRIILVDNKGREEVCPWAWFEQKSREERERLKAWRR